MAHVAAVRSAQSSHRTRGIPVCVGSADSLHPAQHPPVRLVGKRTGRDGGTNVVNAGEQIAFTLSVIGTPRLALRGSGTTDTNSIGHGKDQPDGDAQF